jgi:hypothetical protein
VTCYAESAPAAALWRGDFESGDLKQWDTSTLIKTGDRDNLVLEGDDVAEGKQAARITLRPDVIFEPYNQSRVEVAHNGLHSKNGEDSYFAWSFMVPEDAQIRSNIGYWESTPSYKNTMTFFIEPGGGGTLLEFGTGNLGETVRFMTKLELGKWHRLALHNHWSQSQADGKVDVWYDGTQVVNGATATKFNADQLFFQMGLHRSDPAPPVQVIYIDAAMEADSQADVLMPVSTPGGAGSGGAGSSGAAGAGNGGATAGNASGGGTEGGSNAGMSIGGTSGSAGAETGGAPGGSAPIMTAAGQSAAGSSAALPASSAQDSRGCTLTGPGKSRPRSELLLLVAVGSLALAARRRRGR